LCAEGLQALSGRDTEFLSNLLQAYDESRRAFVPTPESVAFVEALEYARQHGAPMPPLAFERLGGDAEQRAQVIATVAQALQQPLVVTDLAALEHDLTAWWAAMSHNRVAYACSPQTLTDVPDSLDATIKGLQDVRDRLRTNGQHPVVNLKEIAQAHLAEMLAKRRNPDLARGIGSGFPTFDQRRGGLYKGQLGLLAGRQKSGKSMTALRMGISAWTQGHAPLIICHEMLTDLQVRRFAAICLAEKHALSHGRWDPDLMGQLRRARLDDEQWKEYEEFWHAVRDYHTPLLISDPRAVRSTGDIERLVKQHTQEHGVEVVVVDSGQSQTPAEKWSDDRDKQKAVVEHLDRIAQDCEVAMVCDLQTTRDKGLEKSSGPECIAEADTWGRTCFWVLRIWPTGPSTADLQVLIDRDGPCGYSIPLVFDLKAGLIFEQATEV
jgi:archaellum biogenesis ATPase FlaH